MLIPVLLLLVSTPQPERTAKQLGAAVLTLPGIASRRGRVLPCTLLLASLHLFMIGTIAWYSVFFQEAQAAQDTMLCAPRSREVMQQLAAVTAAGYMATAICLSFFVRYRSLALASGQS